MKIKFFRYLFPFWRSELLILILSIMGLGLSLVNPYLTKLVIDQAYGNKDLKLFIILISLGAAIFVLSAFLSGLINYLSRYLRLRVNFNLNRKVFARLERLPYCFFQDSSTAEHLYKISYDIEQASRFIADILPQAISLLPKSLFILVIIFYLNWKIALLALLLTPFLYILPYYFNSRLKKIYKIWIENSQGLFRRLHEILTHIQLVKAFGREKSEARDYLRKRIENIRFGLKNTKVEVAGAFANSLVSRIILGLIIFYGGYQVIKNRMTLGTLSAVSIYLTQLSGLQGALAQFFQQLSLGAVSCERLEAILEAPLVEVEGRNAQEAVFSQGRIEFRNVSFGYNSEKKVLQNLNLVITGGSCLGIAGPSGCGKTTMINLILRLYQPLSGQIFIDGDNINDLKSRSFYAQVGAALQEPYLWNDTIENNIRYDKEGATFSEVQEAAAIAGIDDFINTLPQGYKTLIGENACKISEGQKQRIAIARAVIKRPKILILDEALSSVDAPIETRIIENIRRSFQRSTIIVISHRLSTLAKMEAVYCLENNQYQRHPEGQAQLEQINVTL